MVKLDENKIIEECMLKDINPDDLNTLVLDYLIYEGLGDIAANFASDVNIPFCKSSFLQHRTNIRNSIEEGNIDLSISRINDLNSEIIDNSIKLYYFLMEHKAYEQAQAIHENKEIESSNTFTYLEDVLSFVRSKLLTLVEKDSSLTCYLEDLLEFIVFNSKKKNIFEKRKKLAEYVNEQILERYDVSGNELKRILNRMAVEETALSTTYKFLKFNKLFK